MYKTIKWSFRSGLLLISFLVMSPVLAEDYKLDTGHSFINFKIKHLGYSWLPGRFNKFHGNFSYDEKNPSAAKIVVDIDTASIDSNHAERDKHLRNKDFLDVKTYPKSKFVSTSYTDKGNGKGVMKGDFTLHGVTKSITLDVESVGNGPDPWGGYRRGFVATTQIALKDFNINYNLGPASTHVDLVLSIEGIRK